MLFVRRLALLLLVAVLVPAAAYGTGWVVGTQRADDSAARSAPWAGTRPAERSPSPSPSPSPSQSPTQSPSQSPAESPAGSPGAAGSVAPLAPGPALLATGAEGEEVRDLQARLAQLDWFLAEVTGFYGPVTEEAVRGFQAKRGLAATGAVDQTTLDRLHAMSTPPTAAELQGLEDPAEDQAAAEPAGALDPRCLTGRVICVDKTTSALSWVVDGEVLQTLDARFGPESMPTREGLFEVYVKSRDHVSREYGGAMPYAMFFSGGQAVHYSADFATVGYDGNSHGCVNIRDREGVAWLFDQVRLGDDVVVHRS